MAMELEGGCRVSDMREGAPVVNGTLSIWNQIGRSTGAQAISLRVMQFAPGLSPEVRSGSDEILYVLDWECAPSVRAGKDGKRAPAQVFINGQSCDIDVETGIYLAPGDTFAVNNPGPDQIAVVSCRCPEPDSSQELRPPQTTRAPNPSPARPPLVRLADRPSQPTADRWYRVLVDDEVGSAQATQFVGSIPPGRAPDHFHQYEEVLFILKGQGRMWAGDTNTTIARGSCIYLPRGQVHCVENTGGDELRLLGVFYPAGSPSVRYEV